jgi:trimethylamine--corrinoid protein Co-methyltransferase
LTLLHLFAEGFEINEDKLGFDVITSVGPGGNYLEHEHTLKNFRQELWFPKLLDRNFFEVWDREGRLTLEERILDHLDSILKNHEVDPIDKNLEKEIERIVSHANKRA